MIPSFTITIAVMVVFVLTVVVVMVVFEKIFPIFSHMDLVKPRINGVNIFFVVMLSLIPLTITALFTIVFRMVFKI
jgi:hypothetical protein